MSLFFFWLSPSPLPLGYDHRKSDPKVPNAKGKSRWKIVVRGDKVVFLGERLGGAGRLNRRHRYARHVHNKTDNADKGVSF